MAYKPVGADEAGHFPPRVTTALNATFVPKWKATTAYLAGDAVLSPAGDTVTAIANFTSGASYNAANWNYSPTYATPTGVIADIANPIGQIRAALDYRYSRRGGPVTSGVALFFDDLIKNQYLDGMPYVESVGGRVTFAAWTDRIGVTGCMTSADMVAAAARGHEFANHSKQHVGMTGMTPADRATEYANAKSVLDGILGAGKVTSFVYPQNSNNVVTDRENFLRFDRVFTGANASFIRPTTDRNMFLKGRWGWNSTNHQATLGLIRTIAASGSIIALYTHTIDGTDSAQGVTLLEFKELVDLATTLGIPFLTASEAFPADHAIPDGGFENATLSDNWNITVNGDGSAASVTDTADAGYPGVRSLKMVNGGASATQQVITSKITIPLLNPAIEHSFSCRFRQTVTSGAGGTQLTLRQYDQYNNVLTVSTIPVETTTVGWMQKALAFTPHALATHVRPGFNQTQFVGEAYMDHCHFAPTRNGVYG